jgi:hypothetical protein
VEKLLLQLLTSLEAVGEKHEELFDTEMRSAMRGGIFSGFIKPEPSISLPTDFGLDDEANHAVSEAIRTYVQAANAKAMELGLNFRGRLLAFQNPSVHTPSGTTYDEFFGYTSPDRWTESGEWLGRK